MMREIRSVWVWMVMMAAGAATANAQTAAPAGRYYAEFTPAATLGHMSDSSFGGEAGIRVNDRLEGFLEAGHMGNVATSDNDARAAVVAAFIGGSASVVQKANYVDIGVKYRLPTLAERWRPYVGIGGGVARVRNATHFFVGGNDVTAQLEAGDCPSCTTNVLLGNDLTGSLTKGLIVIPVGVQTDFARRYLVDISYRFGRILARSGAIENDVGISTQRVQVGVGIRF